MSSRRPQAGNPTDGPTASAHVAPDLAFNVTPWFIKSLSTLGHAGAETVTAKLLLDFEPEWRRGATHQLLNTRWQYKQVSADRSCGRLNIRQTRIGKDIRVLIVIMEARRTAYYLSLIHI